IAARLVTLQRGHHQLPTVAGQHHSALAERTLVASSHPDHSLSPSPWTATRPAENPDEARHAQPRHHTTVPTLRAHADTSGHPPAGRIRGIGTRPTGNQH